MTFFLLLLFLIALSACSSILTISTAALVATTWNDSRTIGMQLDDSILKIYIHRALNEHTEIKKFTRITSTVYQGNILLTGQSPSIALSKKAVQIVSSIHGVKNIYNAIRQSQPISFQDILIDSWISNQIRFNLFTQKNKNISNIKVLSENKEIFLLGKVTHEEGYYAKNIAKNCNGVKEVFTIFIYLNNNHEYQ